MGIGLKSKQPIYIVFYFYLPYPLVTLRTRSLYISCLSCSMMSYMAMDWGREDQWHAPLSSTDQRSDMYSTHQQKQRNSIIRQIKVGTLLHAHTYSVHNFSSSSTLVYCVLQRSAEFQCDMLEWTCWEQTWVKYYSTWLLVDLPKLKVNPSWCVYM